MPFVFTTLLSHPKSTFSRILFTDQRAQERYEEGRRSRRRKKHPVTGIALKVFDLLHVPAPGRICTSSALAHLKNM